ncbi:hypothetical protein KYI10_12650 [Macrococcus psychrotolerans]|uniref:Uncharacterized protein n=1 Tax=Macrococcus psychrotolerans TaxID=3039389 RepID=A0AAU7VFW4_9STAP
MKLDKLINLLFIIFVIVIFMHIPNNIFDWHIKTQIRTIQIIIAIVIFILYFINIFIKYNKEKNR